VAPIVASTSIVAACRYHKRVSQLRFLWKQPLSFLCLQVVNLCAIVAPNYDTAFAMGLVWAAPQIVLSSYLVRYTQVGHPLRASSGRHPSPLTKT
jgi:hypothetical protein